MENSSHGPALTKLFISYQSQDRSHAQRLATALSARGFDVWWDRDLLTGDDFRKVISRQLDEADAVIVIWSVNAAGSAWVLDEADTANGRRRLLPVKFDSHFNDIPIGFRSIQVLDLSAWSGKSDSEEIIAIEKKIDAVEQGRRNELLRSFGQSLLERTSPSPDARAILSSLSTSIGGLPLPRFLVGSLMTAIVGLLVLVFWHALTGADYIGWLALLPLAWIAVMTMRAGHQYLLLSSGRGARHFFDPTFSFWMIVCPMIALIIYALNVPATEPFFITDMSTAAILGGALVFALISGTRIVFHLAIWLVGKLD